MDDIRHPPQWLLDVLPEEAAGFLQDGGWWIVLGVLGLLVLLLVWGLLRRFLSVFKRREVIRRDDLMEDLSAIPPPPPSAGDIRLTVEGVPVRVRLVVVAPVGSESRIDPAGIAVLLNQVVVGLGDIAEADQPLARIWPMQISYEGFMNTFHHATPTPEGERRPSRWVVVAGRARVGGVQIMIGLALQTIAMPTTLSRMRLDAHQWSQVLRVRVKD